MSHRDAAARLSRRLVVGLTRLGFSVRGSHELLVRDRKSGAILRALVSVVSVDGVDYLVSSPPNRPWVKHLRAARVGELRVGRHRRSFRATPVALPDWSPVLRAHRRRVSTLISHASETGVASPECVAFRIDTANADLALATTNRDLYINLLKRALMHTLYRPLDIGARSVDVEQEFDAEQTRAQGRDWPEWAQTMIGERRLANVQFCVEAVLREGVPGDFIETGVWRGGTVILMRGILKAYGDPPNRLVFAADSFQGLPTANAADYPADAPYERLLPMAEVTRRPGGLVPSLLAVPKSEVQRNFELYGLFDDRVRFLEGWFRDTLPTVRDRAWAVIRLDGDFYESTMDALVNLYPRLSAGGFLIVDDFAIPACRRAVEDYRKEHGIREPLQTVDWSGVYWRREQ